MEDMAAGRECIRTSVCGTLTRALWPNAIAQPVSQCPWPIPIVRCVQLRSKPPPAPPTGCWQTRAIPIHLPHACASLGILEICQQMQSHSARLHFLLWKEFRANDFFWQYFFLRWLGRLVMVGDLCGRPAALALHLTISWLVKKFQMQLQFLVAAGTSWTFCFFSLHT